MSTGFWVQYILALVVVGFMLLGLYVVVRSLSRGRVLASADRRLVTVVESTMLSQHAGLHVVKAGSRYLLIGGGSAQLSTLGELPAEEVEAWLELQRSAAGLQRASLAQALALFRRKP